MTSVTSMTSVKSMSNQWPIDKAQIFRNSDYIKTIIIKTHHQCDWLQFTFVNCSGQGFKQRKAVIIKKILEICNYNDLK